MGPEDKVQKGKRKGSSKSRHGCQTCKIRRVKCDETKPICKRCHDERYRCDGYLEPSPRKNASKIYALTSPEVFLSHGSSNQPLTCPPSTRLFETETEHSYYRLFCSRVANPASFSPSLWDTLVLQVCERDVSIRHAVIALGALQLMSEATSPVDIQEAKTHNYFALQHYNRAIKVLRRNAIDGAQNVNITLIACILIACFEQSQGQYSSALRQISIGLDLIEDHLRRTTSTEIQLPAIEEQLLQAFESLDVQSLCFIYPHSWKPHKVLQRLMPIKLDDMPSKFLDLLEAKNYYNLISRQLMEFVSEGQGGAEQEQEKAYYFTKLQMWHEGFFPLFKTARYEKFNSDYLLATLLELNHVLMNLTMSLDRTSGLQYNKNSVPALERLVSLVEDVIRHPAISRDTCAFTLEIQVTAPLNFVAWVCPDRSLRRKAIALMTDYPRKEALWDSRIVGRISEWVMLQEEENVGDELKEYFPNDMKCLGTDIFDFDVVERWMKIRCLLPKLNSNGERSFDWVPKEGALITW